ncbi:MAG: hypothetical protein ACPGUY_06400 [Akkermansiaceae bacterium]
MRKVDIHIDVSGHELHDDGVSVTGGFYSEQNGGQFVQLESAKGGENCITLFGESREQVAQWLEGLAVQVREMPGRVRSASGEWICRSKDSEGSEVSGS